MLKNVRNADGRLVAQIDEASHEIIIVLRGCETKLRIIEDGKFSIANTKRQSTSTNDKA